MIKRNTYCEVEFIRKFSTGYIPQISPYDVGILQKNHCWLGLYHFLKDKAYLIIDDASLFNSLAKENDFCTRIKKLWANGNLKIEEQKIDFSSLEEDIYSYIFLCNDHTISEQDAKNLGILVITPSSYSQFTYLFEANGIAIHKEDALDWNLIMKKSNFNALVITDKYILKERNNNLYVLLDALLPESLQIQMHISIFTLDTPTFEKDFHEIEAYIESVRPKLQFNLTLHKAIENDFHDRAIITNYMRVKCGAGFDLIKNKNGIKVSRTTTEVEMDYPCFLETELAEGSYENILLDAKRMYRCNYYLGTKNNRLLNGSIGEPVS